jgi:hypothetical protein
MDDRFFQGSFADLMPTPGLCRVGFSHIPISWGIPDSCGCSFRHNHRSFRKASKGSGGRKRSGASPDGVA